MISSLPRTHFLKKSAYVRIFTHERASASPRAERQGRRRDSLEAAKNTRTRRKLGLPRNGFSWRHQFRRFVKDNRRIRERKVANLQINECPKIYFRATQWSFIFPSLSNSHLLDCVVYDRMSPALVSSFSPLRPRFPCTTITATTTTRPLPTTTLEKFTSFWYRQPQDFILPPILFSGLGESWLALPPLR